VFRTWMVGCLLLPIACSGRDARSGSLLAHAEGDSLDLTDEPQPMVMFRCESGRVGAYLVAGPAPEDSDVLPEDAVRIDLDSALDCSVTAP
jgi:hypothetical protein